MLSLNFPLDCTGILNHPLFNSCFLFYEFRIFQCLSIFMYFAIAFCIPTSHFHGSNIPVPFPVQPEA